MSQPIAEKENESFAANTADMTQDDFFIIAILEMCTDPELSKRFRLALKEEAPDTHISPVFPSFTVIPLPSALEVMCSSMA